MTAENSKLAAALEQWRDSLVNLTGRNRLINYKPTRSSTVEFSQNDAAEVYAAIASGSLTFVTGTRPPEKAKAASEEEGLEERVLDEIEAFDYDDYPDSLFADMTQRNVDRALKNMAGVARREFLDKGLSTLYLALGALQWEEESGDARKSPLILLPAALENTGPREPLHLDFSDDDLSVNPALAIKLSDYGLKLPSAETVIEAIAADDIDAAIDLFRAVDYPDGWEVVNFSTLSNFMFAKEAMYRDLLDNEELVLESELLQALAGDITPETSSFAFEELDINTIDTDAPPETTPLVLDADSSQRAAILAANSGKSFVMDGPPGTGKSQTIANMIGALVAQGKSVLFVSEKIVALEVVRDRLSSRGLDPFSFELHSHKAQRSAVAKGLGESLTTRPVAPTNSTPELIAQAQTARDALSGYATAMNETREPLGLSMFEVLGRSAQSDSSLEPPACSITSATLTPTALTEIELGLEFIQRHWETALEGDGSLWAGLQTAQVPAFDFRLALDKLAALQELSPATADPARAFEMQGLGSVRALHELLTAWSEQPQLQNPEWLLSPAIHKVRSAISRAHELATELEQAEERVRSVWGDNWQSLPELSLTSADEESHWASIAVTRDDLTLERLETLEPYLSTAVNLAQTIMQNAEALAGQLGIKQPINPLRYQDFVDASSHITGATPPLAAWVSQDFDLNSIENALKELKALAATATKAESKASEIFSEGVLGLNLADLKERLPAQTNWLKRLKREYRSALAELLTETQPDTDRRTVAEALPLAIAWKDANDSLTQATARLASTLGVYCDDREADWANGYAALYGAQVIRTKARIESASTLTSVLNSAESRALLRQVLDVLDPAFLEWKTLQSENGDSLTPTAAIAPLQETAAQLATLLADASHLKAYLAQFAPHLTAEITVGEAAAAADVRLAAESAAGAQTNETSTIATALGIATEKVPLTSAQVEKLATQLAWVESLRSLAAPGIATKRKTAPLSADQLSVLRESVLPPVLETRIAEWEQARDTVLSHFDSARQSSLSEDLSHYRSANELLPDFIRHHDSAIDWVNLQEKLETLRSNGVNQPLDYALSTRVPAAQVVDYVMKSVYRSWFASILEADPRLDQSSASDRDALITRFNELDRVLGNRAITTIIESALSRRPRSTAGQGGVILREAEKKRKHIAVRELMDRARDVVQAIHPCFMMSPLAVSQYLPPDMKFDVVIFDEASQVSPGDAINCIYRSKALITVGDQKQLPPTSFFSTSGDIDEDSDEENLAADYESILDLMKSTGNFNSMTLRWHYRSRHEDLISYSNASFYDGKLITFPGAIADSDRYGVKFHKVDGVYRRSAGRDNPIEAEYVAQLVIKHFDENPESSLGVVAFSSTQRDSIENAVALARNSRPDLDERFKDDRIDGFFVKSLESVQGDERDVIIFSVGYGPDETGKFYKNFGPLNQSGGHRRLNVAITRAKELVQLVSSVSAAEIGDVNSEGARHLRRYLDFAERGPAALALELGPAGLGTDSPFEDSVIDAIRSWGFEVQPQVGIAGYRIDIGVKHPNSPGAFMLGVECDGAMYHSSRAARDRDRLRHEVLEGLGWSLHHIWGTAWYRNRAQEEDRLKTLLEQLARETVTGRIVKKQTKRVQPTLELATESHEIDQIPAWVVTYTEASPSRIPGWLDLGDKSSKSYITTLVEEVLSVESPIHIDLLAQRLRDSSGIGRLGARIQENFEAAIKKAGALFDGSFVRDALPRELEVRSPSVHTERSVEQVPPEEIEKAFIEVVKDALGISPEHAAAQVANIFGWRRRGTTISKHLNQKVKDLCKSGVLELTSAGLRVKN